LPSFLKISDAYGHDTAFLQKTLDLLKIWQKDTGSSLEEFSRISKEYGAKNVDFGETLGLFQKWKEADDTATFTRYLEIVSEYDYRRDFIGDKLDQFIAFKADIDCPFTDYLEIAKERGEGKEGDARKDFRAVLPQFKKWKEIEVDGTFLNFLKDISDKYAPATIEETLP